MLFSTSTLLRLPAALYGACPALRCSTKARTRLRLRFVPFPGPSSSGSQEVEGCTLPGCGAPSPQLVSARAVRVPFALCLATTLPADVDHPESQEVFG